MQQSPWPMHLESLHELHLEEEKASRGVAAAIEYEAPSSDSEVLSAEAAVGVRFHPQHLAFLQHANGWNRFAGNIDLFGTRDFEGSSRFAEAKEWVSQMDKRVLGAYAIRRKNLLPVGKSSASTDLLLMNTSSGRAEAPVLWFTNELVEKFADFETMFSRVKGYRRQVVEYWLSRAQLN
jgi:hypothetical protein